jgi:predicted pyridoxine 5'-phosphate oxidase superfamily flavin-nucleotide-binding protein
MTDNFTQLAFTDSVRAVQEDYGTRELYADFEGRAATRNRLTPKETSFIEPRDFFYVATVGESGWPYVQFRGGPPGFLKVLDERTLAFADFKGNGQYISAGNVRDTGKSVLFLMDYAGRSRLKVWATGEVLRAADHPDLAAAVVAESYPATVERIFRYTLEAFDWNCPQHITPRYTLAEVKEEAKANPDFLADCCPGSSDGEDGP